MTKVTILFNILLLILIAIAFNLSYQSYVVIDKATNEEKFIGEYWYFGRMYAFKQSDILDRHDGDYKLKTEHEEDSIWVPHDNLFFYDSIYAELRKSTNPTRRYYTTVEVDESGFFKVTEHLKECTRYTCGGSAEYDISF